MLNLLKIFFLILLSLRFLYATEPAEWNLLQEAQTRILPNAQISANRIFLVTHATKFWDTKEIIRPFLNDRVRQAHRVGIPVVYFIHDFSPVRFREYYFEYKPTFSYESDGGEFKLDLNADEIFVAGGDFGLCLSETVRDAILSTKLKNGVLRVNYLEDSVYFNHRVLTSSVSKLTDSEFFKFILDATFEHKAFGKQNFMGVALASLSDYTFEILRNGRSVGPHGSGPVKIELNFVSPDSLNTHRVFNGTKHCVDTLIRVGRLAQ